MKTPTTLAALILTLLASLSFPTAAESPAGDLADDSSDDPADFRTYVDKIRADGITESGRNALMSVISIRLGYSTLTYMEDAGTGRYTPTYRSTTCPVPSADPQATADLRAQRSAAMTAELARLRALTDTDGSGFVSTAEAVEFRDLFEFGVLLQAVAARSGQAKDAIRRAAGLDETALETRLAAFRDLERRAADVGLALGEIRSAE